MRVGLSTASFYPELNTEDALSIMPNLGVDLAEVFLSSYSEYSQDFGKLCHQRAQDAGITVHAIHTLNSQFEPQLFAPHARQCQDAERIYRAALSAGHAMGAKHYVFHGPTNLKNRDPVVVNFPHVAHRAQELVEIAQEYGIRLCWENVHWCQYATPDFGPNLLHNMPDDTRLGFVLDVKQAMQSGRTALEFLPGMAKRLCGVHLCDFIGKSLCLPGQGEYDFVALANALHDLGRDIPAFVEVYRGDYDDFSQLHQSVVTMQRIFASEKRDSHGDI